MPIQRQRGVTVCIRTRPTAFFAQDQIIVDENGITVNNRTESDPSSVLQNRNDTHSFRYHSVLHNSSQEQTYVLANEVVSSALEGVNGTVMAYGQTGSGKTFTMIGDTSNYQHRGVAPRGIAQIFGDMSLRPEIAFKVRVSYMEIYNEHIYDLLAPPSSDTTSRAKMLNVVETKNGGTDVQNLTKLEVSSEEEALDFLFKGEMNRITAEHMLNKNSNRSHCIFTVYLDQRPRIGDSEKIISSKLHFVDLAGSERLKKTVMREGAEGKGDTVSQKESMYINKSLSYLEQCVMALTTKSRNHIPYRQTKLTNVLKDSLGGSCKTLFIACIWGEADHLEESVSTLKLAQRMMKVQNHLNVNVVKDPQMLLKKQAKQIEALKQELMMHDALSDRSNVVYDEYTPDQQAGLRNQLLDFLKSEEGDEKTQIGFDSVRKMHEIMRQMRSIYNEMKTLAAENARGGTAMGNRPESVMPVQNTSEAFPTNEDYAGELDQTGGFALGLAAADARPQNVDYLESMGSMSPIHQRQPSKVASDLLANTIVMPGDRNEAFELFKKTEGQQLNFAVKEAKALLKELRSQVKEMASAVNDSKRAIDDINDKLEVKKQQGQNDGVLDEEEFALLESLKENKLVYKEKYSHLRAAKDEMQKRKVNIETCRSQLITGFDAWHAQNSMESVEISDGGDKLDDAEQFEKLMVERVTASDPDSLAFFNAQKRMKHTMNKGGLKVSQGAIANKRGRIRR
eukprot:TRINITY_DN295_c3_g2_i1.p1 TRINITY_DN295_c3_g2~~TRINITY_DN295_c3_g2_i1.p1  ORF type:complete len:737 (-),score=250.98 TRINITY_DN295_c3_g2_i1:2-2212(-)